MADTKVSAFPAASALTGAEETPVVQGGAHKKTTAGAIARTYETVKVVTADVSESAAGNIVVSDLSMAGIAAGTYRITGRILWKTAATTTGITMFFNASSSAGSNAVYATFTTPTTGTTQTTAIAQTSQPFGNNTMLLESKIQNALNSSPGGWAGVQAANQPVLTTVDGLLVVGGSLTFELKFASEAGGGSAATIMAGSVLSLEKVA